MRAKFLLILQYNYLYTVMIRAIKVGQTQRISFCSFVLGVCNRRMTRVTCYGSSKDAPSRKNF